MAINNTVTLIGNLGAEADHITENTTKPFVAVRLATTDSYKDEESGEWKDLATVWHSVVAFSPKVIEELRALRKGARVQVTGSLSYRPYKIRIDDKDVEKFEASIIARKVELTPLPKKQPPKDAAK